MKSIFLSFLALSITIANVASAQSNLKRTERLDNERVINGVVVKADNGASTALLEISFKGAKGLITANKICGASLVSPRFVENGRVAWIPGDRNARWAITAAHCLLDRKQSAIPANNIKLIAGRLNKSQTDTGEERKVLAAISHENFQELRKALSHDVAILYLDEASKDPEIDRYSIALPRIEERELSYKAYLSLHTQGWGRTSVKATGKKSPVLLEANVPLVDWDVCKSAYDKIGATDQIEFNMLCAGSLYNGGDACKGDSGGPLMFRPESGSGLNMRINFSHPILLGVVSWSEACGRQDLYGVYASVTQFIGWFDEKVHQLNDCRKNADETKFSDCLKKANFTVNDQTSLK